MRFLRGGLVLMGLGLVAWAIWPEPHPGIDPMTSAAVSSAQREDYTISNMESGKACLIARGNKLTRRSSAVVPEHDCDLVWPGLAGVRNWTQNDDGTVELTDPAGTAVLTLAAGDGVAYETLEPSNAVLALTEVR